MTAKNKDWLESFFEFDRGVVGRRNAVKLPNEDYVFFTDVVAAILEARFLRPNKEQWKASAITKKVIAAPNLLGALSGKVKNGPMVDVYLTPNDCDKVNDAFERAGFQKWVIDPITTLKINIETGKLDEVAEKALMFDHSGSFDFKNLDDYRKAAASVGVDIVIRSTSSTEFINDIRHKKRGAVSSLLRSALVSKIKCVRFNDYVEGATPTSDDLMAEAGGLGDYELSGVLINKNDAEEFLIESGYSVLGKTSTPEDRRIAAEQAMKEHGDIKERAAESLGISSRSLGRWLKGDKGKKPERNDAFGWHPR